MTFILCCCSISSSSVFLPASYLPAYFCFAADGLLFLECLFFFDGPPFQKRCSSFRPPHPSNQNHRIRLLNMSLHEYCFAPCTCLGQPREEHSSPSRTFLPTPQQARPIELLTARMATPSRRLLSVLSPCNERTPLVDCQLHALNSGSPSTTASPGFAPATSKSRTNAFVLTRPPASLELAAALSTRNPDGSTLQREDM